MWIYASHLYIFLDLRKIILIISVFEYSQKMSVRWWQM